MDYDAVIPIVKLAAALAVLALFARFPERYPDTSPFFARHKWTLWDAYKVVAAQTVALLLVIAWWWPHPTSPDLGTFLLSYFAVIITFGSAIERRHGIRYAHLGFSKTCFFGSGVIALNVVLAHFVLLVAGGGIPPLNRLILHDANNVYFWFYAALSGSALAFCEELLFRGALYAPVARRLGKGSTIVALSLVECLMHDRVDVLQSCVLFLVFVLFYWVYIRTESMVAPLILHVGMNVPAWQPGSMSVIAPYVDMSSVQLLCISAPLWALIIINTWRLVSVPTQRTASCPEQ